MFRDTRRTRYSILGRRLVTAVLGTTLLAVPVAAHGTAGRVAGVAFPAVVAASVAASLLGGGLVLVAVGRLPRWRGAVPVLLLALGALSILLAVGEVPTGAAVGLVVGVGAVTLARDHAVSDCGACADATLGAVTLHRGFEGVVLATVYAADAALGLVGAAVLAVHAAAETAAVGSLYATAGRRYALGAVCLLQVGFVAGVAVGWRVVDGVPVAVEAGLLALVGGVLLAIGTREGYHRYAGRLSAPVASADARRQQ
jgi:zinc transporter ZupT